MKHALFLLALACIATPAWGSFEEETGILELDPSNFEEAVRWFPYLMVEFYAPWCTYCQAFAPKYETAANKLAEKGSLVRLARLDATLYPDFAAEMGVEEYPTMYFYREGTPMYYDGELDVAPLVRWVQRKSRLEQSSQAVSVVELNQQNFASAVQNYPMMLVEFYAPWCPHCQEFAPKYLKAAHAMARINPNVLFATVDATEQRKLAEEQGIQRYPTLKLFYYGESTIYDGPLEVVSLVDWLAAYL